MNEHTYYTRTFSDWTRILRVSLDGHTVYRDSDGEQGTTKDDPNSPAHRGEWREIPKYEANDQCIAWQKSGEFKYKLSNRA